MEKKYIVGFGFPDVEEFSLLRFIDHDRLDTDDRLFGTGAVPHSVKIRHPFYDIFVFSWGTDSFIVFFQSVDGKGNGIHCAIDHALHLVFAEQLTVGDHGHLAEGFALQMVHEFAELPVHHGLAPAGELDAVDLALDFPDDPFEQVEGHGILVWNFPVFAETHGAFQIASAA